MSLHCKGIGSSSLSAYTAVDPGGWIKGTALTEEEMRPEHLLYDERTGIFRSLGRTGSSLDMRESQTSIGESHIDCTKLRSNVVGEPLVPYDGTSTKFWEVELPHNRAKDTNAPCGTIKRELESTTIQQPDLQVSSGPQKRPASKRPSTAPTRSRPSKLSRGQPTTFSYIRHSSLSAVSLQGSNQVSDAPLITAWERGSSPWDGPDFGEDVFGYRPASKIKRKPAILRKKRPVLSREAGSKKSSVDVRGTLGMTALYKASLLEVFDENNKVHKFGGLFEGQSTVVVFIRHFWCPISQGYMRLLAQAHGSAALKTNKMSVLAIGCGDPALIKGYRAMLQLPFPIYSDPSLQLYTAMGMTSSRVCKGINRLEGAFSRGGSVQRSFNALKNRIKCTSMSTLFKNGGNATQLGGEFIIGPGLRRYFSRKMDSTQSHTSIDDLLACIAVRRVSIPQRSVSFVTVEEEEKWMEEREAALHELRERRVNRRYSHVPIYANLSSSLSTLSNGE